MANINFDGILKQKFKSFMDLTFIDSIHFNDYSAFLTLNTKQMANEKQDCASPLVP